MDRIPKGLLTALSLLFLVALPFWNAFGQIHHRKLFGPKKKALTPVVREFALNLRKRSASERRPYQFATPLIVGNFAYVGIDHGFFYCIDLTKGRRKWNLKTLGPIHGRAAYLDGQVFFGDLKGGFYALDAAEGKIVWSTELGYQVMSAPLVVGDYLYVVTQNKQLWRFDRSHGNLVWQTPALGRDVGFTLHGAADPVWVDGLVIAGFSDGSLIAFDGESGNVRWVRQLGNRTKEIHDLDAPMLLEENVLFVSSADGHFFAMEANSGRILWETPVGTASRLLADGEQLFLSSGSRVVALEKGTGKILWDEDLKSQIRAKGGAVAKAIDLSGPVAFRTFLAMIDTRGKLYFLDRISGKFHSSRFLKRGAFSQPVITDDRMILLANSGRLYGLRFK